MVAFARFVMRDNGLPIHINADQVTQVRQTSEGEPAIYTLGRDTPMIVEGTLEAAIRKLEAASAGVRVVEPVLEPVVEATVPESKPPVLELISTEPQPEPAPSVEPEPEPEVVTPAKSKPKAKAAKAKTAKAKTAKSEEASPQKLEPPYPSASWFMGNR